jgi:hypothetical protein
VEGFERGGNDSREWHQGQGRFAGYRFYSDVSVDNFNAVLYGYAIYYDLAADAEQKKMIAYDVDRLMTHLLDNHYRIIDLDGEATQYPLRKLSGSRSLPMRNLLHGWQISGVLPAQTGNPINITQETAFEGSRADFAGGDAKRPDYRQTLRYLDPSPFALVPIGQRSGAPIRPGNIGRNALRDIGRWNTASSRRRCSIRSTKPTSAASKPAVAAPTSASSPAPAAPACCS